MASLFNISITRHLNSFIIGLSIFFMIHCFCSAVRCALYRYSHKLSNLLHRNNLESIVPNWALVTSASGLNNCPVFFHINHNWQTVFTYERKFLSFGISEKIQLLVVGIVFFITLLAYCDIILAKSLLNNGPSIFASCIVVFVVIQLYKAHK
jgi:hypothetical protein